MAKAKRFRVEANAQSKLRAVRMGSSLAIRLQAVEPALSLPLAWKPPFRSRRYPRLQGLGQ
jgi:hypothetical protein